MQSSLPLARDAIQSAHNHADEPDVRRQLTSIDRALADLSGEERLADDTIEGARLEELERQLVTLGNTTEGVVESELETARDHIDGFRQQHAQDWE